jgi:hypothetical protein
MSKRRSPQIRSGPIHQETPLFDLLQLVADASAKIIEARNAAHGGSVPPSIPESPQRRRRVANGSEPQAERL